MEMGRKASKKLMEMGVEKEARICVEGLSERDWPVKIIMRRPDHGHVFVLSGGWKRFIADNKLKIGKELHFTWKGPRDIAVRIERRSTRGRPPSTAAAANYKKHEVACKAVNSESERCGRRPLQSEAVSKAVKCNVPKTPVESSSKKCKLMFYIHMQEALRQPLTTCSFAWDLPIEISKAMFELDGCKLALLCKCNKAWFSSVTNQVPYL
ncbi:hypothetical protein GOP47_0024514 [Adiantum capillus-veneris]|uniref:TF-B3 domain-containing protein n=1 Tax=Adiantum capillus-veneris TaxID=13818 RepID=A0A9D4U201_ADICA|nr:hypothetical protein GOP47_0024514 [Adiantum capillus-veneris]